MRASCQRHVSTRQREDQARADEHAILAVMQPRGAGFPAAGAKKATAEAPTHYDRLILLNGHATSSSGPLVSQPQDRILHQVMTLYPDISAADPFRRLVNAFLRFTATNLTLPRLNGRWRNMKPGHFLRYLGTARENSRLRAP